MKNGDLASIPVISINCVSVSIILVLPIVKMDDKTSNVGEEKFRETGNFGRSGLFTAPKQPF